ncbi:MAG: glycosyltransferase family 2 protein [Burkholderiaceae bacterium]
MAAIVVLYRPDVARLTHVLDALAAQVAEILCVDNGTPPHDLEALRRRFPTARWLPMGTNAGVGAAQNQGIACARELGCSHVLLCDQDSIADPGMVDALLAAEQALSESNRPIAAVGPRYRLDDQGRLSTFVVAGWAGFKRRDCQEGQTGVEADFLIASGCLIRLAALNVIGEMDASFFIDHVDTEWCLRARSHGYRIGGACLATMSHQLGEETVDLRWPRPRSVAIHKPFRYYYIFRNSLRMYRMPHVPLRWIVPDCVRLLQLYLFVGLVSPQRFECIRMMHKGLLDGLRDVQGALR